MTLKTLKLSSNSLSKFGNDLDLGIERFKFKVLVILIKWLLNVLAIIELSVTNLFLRLSMMLLVGKPLS